MSATHIEQNNDKNMIAKAIESMAMMDTESKKELKESTKDHDFNSWKTQCLGKGGGVGFLTGLAGGPVGIALEVADTGYLIAMAGRASYGVGHIHNKVIDYENDIEGILAIWAGAGKTINKRDLALKTAIPVAGKIIVKANFKFGMKIAAKLSSKILAKASAKLSAKIASKLATKWVPILGGVVSGAINIWVLDGLIDAAEDYYTSDAILINEDVLLN